MKIRNSHVSNSSSSSFIIGVGFVPGNRVDEFRALDVTLLSLNELQNQRWYEYRDDTVSVDSFIGSHVCLYDVTGQFQADPNGMVAILDTYGAEPTWDSESYGYNYHAVSETPEWFSTGDLKTADAIRSVGGSVEVGAGYNG